MKRKRKKKSTFQLPSATDVNDSGALSALPVIPVERLSFFAIFFSMVFFLFCLWQRSNLEEDTILGNSPDVLTQVCSSEWGGEGGVLV